MAGGIKSGAMTASVVTVYEKISDDLAKKKTEEEIDLKAMKERLATIDATLALIAREPDEVLLPNISKITSQRMMELEKAQIEKILGLCR